jgi:hypothetical protein
MKGNIRHKKISLCKVWIFEKLFGTRLFVCPSQRICCTNMITNEVVDFYHMVIKVRISYKCKQSKRNQMFNQ